MLNIFINGKGIFIITISMTKQSTNKECVQWFGKIRGRVGLQVTKIPALCKRAMKLKR